MRIAKIEKENLASRIVDKLSNYIIENRLRAGDKLPTEHQLAELFGVSRNAIREALKAMEVIGILESSPKRGIFISGQGIKPHLLPFVFGILSGEDAFRYLVDLRIIVERTAVRLAVSHATDEEVKKLLILARESDIYRNQAAEEVDESLLEQVALQEVNFHRMLIELSHNPILIKLGSLWSLFFTMASSQNEDHLSFAQSIYQKNVDHMHHVDIAEAVKNRDADKAEEAILSHLQYWQSHSGKIEETQSHLTMAERIYKF